VNAYLIIILASLIGAYLLHFTSRRLNANALDPNLPEEFADSLDADRYARSQEYARANMGFDDVNETVNLLIILAFILLGGFNVLDTAVRSLGLGSILTGLAYFAGLGLLSGAIGLPFDIYHTFVLENRFGFNTTTWGTFLADKIKGLLLGAVIGGLLLSAILWFFQAAGSLAWVWCWGFAVAFTLLLTYVAPQWILPLFNKFTPLEDGELRNRIKDYAGQEGYRLSGIFVMDGSKRSTKANAFFTGFGKTKRIALFDTLVDSLATDELLGVLAHEVGHGKLGHIKKRLVTMVFKTGAVFFLMSLFLNNRGLFDAFNMEHMSIHAGLVFFGLLYTPVSMILSVVSSAVSRKHEFEADAFAAKTTGAPEKLADALKKLSIDSLSNLTPHPFTVWLDYSHPPVLQRIRALRRG